LKPCRREELIEYTDRRGVSYRAAALDETGAVSEILLVGAPRQIPAYDWLLSLLAARRPLTKDERLAVLSGRSPTAAPAIGRIVCACFNVGVNQLASAITAGCDSLERVGAKLNAGTNCGSCR